MGASRRQNCTRLTPVGSLPTGKLDRSTGCRVASMTIWWAPCWSWRSSSASAACRAALSVVVAAVALMMGVTWLPMVTEKR
ncbi:hypothetical protein [Nitrospirillum iridis]|uniref:Uncharacterized protein n=1 Tax=Nitrospirillum iridis TaxID=765888 RepID=A0A7X0AWM2_9PROT|nr:hypothetical protein [Nitrospirillum iridis]MBB6251453.1 hypothetical protein [Nitrospirillum iridis]